MQLMDKGALGWLQRTVARNHWRVASWYDVTDLIQDGHLHWLRIVRRYPKVKNPAHRMRLFQVTYICWLHDLANKRMKQIDMPISDILTEDADEQQMIDRLAGSDVELVNAGPLIGNTPIRVKYFFQLLQMAPLTRRRLNRLLKVYQNIAKETRAFLADELLQS